MGEAKRRKLLDPNWGKPLEQEFTKEELLLLAEYKEIGNKYFPKSLIEVNAILLAVEDGKLSETYFSGWSDKPFYQICTEYVKSYFSKVWEIGSISKSTARSEKELESICENLFTCLVIASGGLIAQDNFPACLSIVADLEQRKRLILSDGECWSVD